MASWAFSFLVRTRLGGVAALAAAASIMDAGQRSTNALVLGDRNGITDSSTVGRLYRVRDTVILAITGSAGDGSEHIYHRPGIYRSAARSLRGGLVAAWSALCDIMVAGRSMFEHRLFGVVVGGEGHRRTRGAAGIGRGGSAACAAFLGAHAVQHASLARCGHDAGRISRE